MNKAPQEAIFLAQHIVQTSHMIVDGGSPALRQLGEAPRPVTAEELMLLRVELHALLLGCAYCILVSWKGSSQKNKETIFYTRQLIVLEQLKATKTQASAMESALQALDGEAQKYISIWGEFSGSKRISRIIARYIGLAGVLLRCQPTSDQVGACFREIADHLLAFENKITETL